MRPKTRRLRLGVRRESLILLPVAMLLLIALSAFALLSYRQNLEMLTEERRQEAAELARRLSRMLAAGEVTTPQALRPFLPSPGRLALVDARGRSRGALGLPAAEDLLRPAAGHDLEAPFAVGPAEAAPGWIVAYAPLELRGERLLLRVDLPARHLAGQRGGLRLLFWVVLVADLAVAALVVVYLRHLLMPFETMLARARQLQPVGEGAGEDEIAYLVSTFERAVDALARPSAATTEDDIAALERTLGPSLESGMLLLDLGGRVLTLNRFGAELLGVETPVESGVALDRLLPHHPRLVEFLTEAVSRGRTVQRLEVEVRRGEVDRTLGLTVHLLRRDDGEGRAFVILFADLTEAQRLREQRRLSTTLDQIGELAAGVAHEMRNGMATISGYLSLVERSPDEDDIQEYVRELRRETAHLRRVLEDFLSFARPGTTRMEEIDLATVVGRAASDPALAGLETSVERRGDGSTLLQGDAQLLQRAVSNLLRNSADAQRRAGREEPLEIVIEATREAMRLTIADRGDGIPAEIRERLFQPFASSRPDGVGLGLALARRIVDLHQGSLRLEDRAGGGTRAVILFEHGTIVTNGNDPGLGSAREPSGAQVRK